jgi:hypothetical protein
MSIKTRLVLVDDDDVEDLEGDLASPEVMEYYWRHTGNVATYWVSAAISAMPFPAVMCLGIPRCMTGNC